MKEQAKDVLRLIWLPSLLMLVGACIRDTSLGINVVLYLAYFLAYFAVVILLCFVALIGYAITT